MDFLPYVILIILALLVLPFLLGWSISFVKQRPFWQYLLVVIPIVAFLLINFRRWIFIFTLAMVFFLVGFSLPISQSERKRILIVIVILVVLLILALFLVPVFWPLPDTM